MTSPSDPPEVPDAAPTPTDPATLLRSRSYVGLLVLGAIVGVPVAFIAFFYLKSVNEAQQYLFTTLPNDLGFHGEPMWWPLPLLALCGVLVGLTIHYLPGPGGHEPANGFQFAGPAPGIELPGIILASFATLALGAVLGPEAPLVAIGGGLGALAVHLIKRDAPAMATMVIGGAGSFAAISTLLGSPLTGAFLLMEAAGLGGTLMAVVMMPGLLAAGVGALIFVGLDKWTGFGTFSLAVPDIPHAGSPTGSEFLWALVIGLAASVLGNAIRYVALSVKPFVTRRRLLLSPLVGLFVGAAAIAFAEASGKSSSQVLFSGENSLAGLIEGAAGWTVGALVLLVLFKGLAYSASLSAFRGGPTFPGMFIGAAGGMALSHLPGLPMIAGVGMGIGAMTVVMLDLPLTSVLLASVFLQADALQLMPLIICAVVVAFVASARIRPLLPPITTEEPAAASP
jgi:H+/Cl- antiporter ClcA